MQVRFSAAQETGNSRVSSRIRKNLRKQPPTLPSKAALRLWWWSPGVFPEMLPKFLSHMLMLAVPPAAPGARLVHHFAPYEKSNGVTIERWRDFVKGKGKSHAVGVEHNKYKLTHWFFRAAH
ncbi:MAG TPA: hypothetical protein VFG29_13075 [Syntrophales bacterium]|nr:hypothetical protein [Syntrophales bacterium]